MDLLTDIALSAGIVAAVCVAASLLTLGLLALSGHRRHNEDES